MDGWHGGIAFLPTARRSAEPVCSPVRWQHARQARVTVRQQAVGVLAPKP